MLLLMISAGAGGYLFATGWLARNHPEKDRWVRRQVGKWADELGKGPSSKPMDAFKRSVGDMLDWTSGKGDEAAARQKTAGESAKALGPIYSWIDEKGIRHFAGEPPPEGTADVRIIPPMADFIRSDHTAARP